MNTFLNKEFLIYKVSPFVLFLAVVYFPIFMHLGTDAIGMWDESLFALRAFYFAFTDNYLMNFLDLDLRYDHPNTKPPLMTWVQGYFFRWFGYSELSLRLPIAITVLIMLFFLIRFAAKEFGHSMIGYLAALILVTSQGFMDKHVARTGDHDAVLAFEFLLVFVYFYRMVTQPDKQNKFVWWVALFLATAVLTKSVAGLFPLPALFIYALVKKRLLPILKSWHTYGAILMFLALVLGYYFYREWQYPGFLQTVWNEEIGGRYMEEIDGHNQVWYWYIQRIYEWRFTPWLYFVPVTILFFFTDKGKEYRDFGLFMLLGAVSILTTISISETKCEWYDAGIYPLLAIFVAIGIFQLLQARPLLGNNAKSWRNNLFALFLVMALFAHPYDTIIKKVAHPSKGWSREQIGEFMREMDPSVEYTVATKTLNLPANWYHKVLTHLEGRKITMKRYSSDYEVGELVMSYQDLRWAQKRFHIKEIHRHKKLKLFRIESFK